MLTSLTASKRIRHKNKSLISKMCPVLWPKRLGFYKTSSEACNIQAEYGLTLETELEGRSITNRMELSGEINQDLFLCMLWLAWRKSY